MWPFGQRVECIFECVRLRFENGLRFPWPPASIVRALSLEGQLPSAFAWSCLFNLTQWRKAWHWPESAALMCFMFCIHHCHWAGEDCRCHRRTGGCVCVCGVERNTCVWRWGKNMIHFLSSITTMIVTILFFLSLPLRIYSQLFFFSCTEVKNIKDHNFQTGTKHMCLCLLTVQCTTCDDRWKLNELDEMISRAIPEGDTKNSAANKHHPPT